MTSTMTRVQASRPQDYLYDPLYTVSCYNDHVKAWSSAQNVRAVILPNYDNMFSQVATHPPHSVEIRVSRVDPNLGHNRYVPLDPNPQVTGTNRFKYFRRPLIPYTENPGGQLVYVKQQQHADTVGLASTAVTPGTAADAAAATATGFTGSPGKPVSVGVQTMYRESGAQTDPYSPEYILASTSTSTRPEILALAHLKHGQGLPAGLQEVEMIERARAKREWEKTLPAVTDDASFQRRLRMMEAMELSEWAEREKEIKRLQDRRLAVLAAALDKRNRENESQAAAKMHAIWQRKLAEKDALRAKMDVRRVKELRKLQEKRKQVEGRLKKRDIIAEYASVTSDVYLPKMRKGIPTHTQSVMERVLAKRPTAVALAGQMQGGSSSAAFMDSVSGNSSALASAKATPGITRAAQPAVPLPALEHLESLFPASVTHASLAPPMLGSHMQTPASRKEAAMLAQLNAMDSKLREMKQRESQSQILLASGENRPRFLRPVPKPVERVPTPCTDAPDADEDARHQIALVIQRWLRGRRVQDEMLVGKSRRAHLIEELRLELQAEKIRLAAEEDQRRLRGPAALVGPPIATLADQVASTFEDTIQADFVGQQLDFLDREIKRLQDQQSLAAMAALAERARRMREAQEAGNRQRELAMRYEEDRKFRAIMQIHQGTVDSFLEEVVASSTQQAADMRARMRVRSAIDRAKGRVHDLTPWDKEKKEAASRDDAGQLPPETLVANLVSSFLFPETERRLVREQVAQAQQRYLLAAHRAVYGVLDEVVEAPLAGSQVPISEQLVDEYTSDLKQQSDSPQAKEFSISKSEEELVARLRPDLIVSNSDSSDDSLKLQQQNQEQPGMSAKILSHSFEDMLKLGTEVPLPASRPGSTLPPSTSASRPSTARAGRRAAGDSRPGSSSTSRHFGQ
ncbi:solute carrier, TRAMD3 or PAT1-domain-containing protein [Catenaria anguillulae PL171]|uniref:Cilia- and flagella-associated protein 91 n=1 Tax=Catenaria anguillulae PL171 TaxID=765915 RepID=A0A1Y2HTP4_9FUNG|nr:solute carrier, TRAMD3 or PAT1-domain-containing protein [Catenaria anguillulae PL171]